MGVKTGWIRKSPVYAVSRNTADRRQPASQQFGQVSHRHTCRKRDRKLAVEQAFDGGGQGFGSGRGGVADSASHDASVCRYYFLPDCARFRSSLLHRCRVFAAARSLVAACAVIQSLLCRQYICLLALPKLQGRLLDGAGKREDRK